MPAALARIAPRRSHHDLRFLFPQDDQSQRASGWRPAFVDDVYASYTNATAFSPSDTLPLSATAKLLMAVQSLTALVRPSSWRARLNALG